MCGCQDNKEYRFGGNIDETSIRLQYANEDIELLEKSYSGAMSITDTKHGLLDLNYNKGTKIYEIYNKGNKLYSGDRNGAIDFIADSFIIEYDDEQEGIDLFEDYENIPEEVQAILDEYQTAFEDGDYKGLEQAHKELERIGYTFDYYLDGQAYDLRPIGTKGKVELESEKFDKEHPKFQEGGSIDSERRFTEFDFNKLMDGEGFRAIWSGYVWEIYPEGGGKVLGKFNPKTKKLFIIGKKDLSNTLVEYLQQNSYVSNEEYFKLENGGGVGNGMLNFVVNEMSSGFIANNSNANTYSETSAIRNKMIKILQESGDRDYSLKGAVDLVKEAEMMRYADGGGVDSIPNNYEGKSPKDIWASWSKEQRKHFLYDHKSDARDSDEVGDSKGYYYSHDIDEWVEMEWNELPLWIKNLVFEHTDNGQYAKGGGVGKKTKAYYFGKDEFGRKIYMALAEYPNDTMWYVQVDGDIYSVNDDGEPISIAKNIDIVDEEGVKEMKKKAKELSEKIIEIRKNVRKKMNNGGEKEVADFLTKINERHPNYDEKLASKYNKLLNDDPNYTALTNEKLNILKVLTELGQDTNVSMEKGGGVGTNDLVKVKSLNKDGMVISKYKEDKWWVRLDYGKPYERDEIISENDLIVRKGNENRLFSKGGGVGDWFWNYAYRHYLRDASLSQRNKVKSEFIKRGLELDGESPEHAYIVVSIVKPEDLKYFNKISDNAIEYEIGGTLSLPSFASEGISADRFKERQKAFVGYLGDVISIQIAETFLGRKINSWEDDIIIIGDTKYKKIYLKPEYKRIN